MSKISRKKIILALLATILLAAVGWLFTRRTQRIALASYVPQSAIGYLEINDWPQLVDRFASTTAWRQIAPTYGVENKLDYLGKVGWLASFTGGNEAAVMARSQLAIVMTGLEVRGEAVKPRLALIAETHSSPNDLSKVIEKRLPELARNIYGREIKEKSEYGGVTITGYTSGTPDSRLLSAQIKSEWILANHADSMRACIDARLGRAPSMANDFYLKNSRDVVARSGEMFGFITGDGVTRLLRFGAFLLSSGALSGTGIIEVLQDVLSDLASRSSDGVAYGASFENGAVVDRYALLFKPDLVESLKPSIKINQGEPQSLNYIPSTVKDVTVFNVENPDQTLDGIETAISARIGVGQGFLLHQFMIGARETFLGVKSGDGAQSPIGNEIANFIFTRESTGGSTKESEDRVWLIAARDRQLISRIAERYLAQQGGAVRRENYSGVEIIGSSNAGNARKGSAAIIGDFLALGGRMQLIRLIEDHRKGQSFKSASQFAAANRPSQKAAMISFSSVKDESGEMMSALADWLGGAVNMQSIPAELDRLPFAASAVTLKEQGVYIESHSSFGNFPFFVSLVAGATSEK